MIARRTARLAALGVVALAAAVPVRADKPAAKPAPWYVDDFELFDRITEKIGELAKRKKCLPPARLKKLMAKDRTCSVTPARPTETRLDPEDVYERVLPGVFVVGSVVEEDGEYADGWRATAWALTADGVLVTTCHTFSEVADNESFGVVDHKGRAYPVTNILAVNKAADVCVFKVAATGLTPLPVADRPARVGSWVGVLGHPGDHYFTFTQGHVARYATQKTEGGAVERWVAVTAEYASGSSGSPVLDRRGAVVGMAAMTETIEYEAEPEKADDGIKISRRHRSADPPKGEKKPEPPPASTLEMVVKLATPAADIRKAIGAE
jgi:S1-C subfamily serine protease